MFIWSSASVFLGFFPCFPLLIFMNKTTINILAQTFVWTLIFIYLSHVPSSIFMFTFIRNLPNISPFSVLASMIEHASCTTSVPASGVVRLCLFVSFCHPSRCDLLYLRGFSLHLLAKTMSSIISWDYLSVGTWLQTKCLNSHEIVMLRT